MTSSDPATDAGREINALVQALGGAGPMPPWNARGALETIGRPAVPALRVALGSGRPEVRWEAAKTLATIADASAAADLVGALEDEDGSVRWLAAEGLSRLGHAGLVPLLHALIEHSGSAWLRDGARHVLRASLNDADAPALVPVLAAIAGPVPEIAVMPAASRALTQLALAPAPPVRSVAAAPPAPRLPSMTPAHGTWRNLHF